MAEINIAPRIVTIEMKEDLLRRIGPRRHIGFLDRQTFLEWGRDHQLTEDQVKEVIRNVERNTQTIIG